MSRTVEALVAKQNPAYLVRLHNGKKGGGDEKVIILVMIEGNGEDAWRERNDARNDATE